MAGAFTSIDLSQLAMPDVVETLDFNVIVSQMLADLIARDPGNFTALVESDPAYKTIEICAYREVLLRQRINEACQAVMLAFARKNDLDQIGANFDVERLTITPADLTTIPPTDAVMEQDDLYRARIQLSFEGFTTAGSTGSYVFASLSADGRVKDVAPVSPSPGVVTVYVLSADGNGEAEDDVIENVQTALNADTVRPMTDQVNVVSAAIVEYQITAVLEVFNGPDSASVLAAAQIAGQAYADSVHMMGADVALSGIYKALHQVGVKQVDLTLPAANIAISDGQAGYCTAINITTVVASNG